MVLNIFSLAGKTALITGASSGLGKSMALTLARAGANVSLVARRRSQLEEVHAQICELGGRAHVATLDVTDLQAIDPVLAEAEAALGPIDVLVNNAGISMEGRALEVDAAAYDAVLNVNTRGPFFMAQAVARRMVADERPGSIVNIASLISLKVVNNLATYAMSKSALDHMTRALAREWARHGIRVNSIQPGYIKTEINAEFFDSPPGQKFIASMPNKRLGMPSDLDGPLLLLASDASRGMSGACLLVDDNQINAKV